MIEEMVSKCWEDICWQFDEAGLMEAFIKENGDRLDFDDDYDKSVEWDEKYTQALYAFVKSEMKKWLES